MSGHWSPSLTPQEACGLIRPHFSEMHGGVEYSGVDLCPGAASPLSPCQLDFRDECGHLWTKEG